MRLISAAGIVLLALIAVPSFAQKRFTIPKVTKADLELKKYERDTSAQAVILFDIGHMNGADIIFSRHMRIKILNKAGLDWGNQVFNTPTTSEFRVTVYNLENGEVVSEKAAQKSIFEEKIINQYSVYKVFAPNVKVGSIIDIYYEHLGPPFEWRFQQRVPVVYSELVLQESVYVSFRKTFFGFEPIQTIGPDEWRAVNMPAFKTEPFLNNYSNYLSKFQIEIQTIMTPAYVSRKHFVDLSTTWPKVIELLLKDQDFGGVLTGCAFLNDFARSTTERKDLSTQQKIEVAIAYIRKNIKWNNHETIFASDLLRNNFKTDHDGNSADVNLTLIALLNKMDIKTTPVVFSTRDNGMILDYSTTLNKLNYVVGLVRQDGITMLVDATSTYIKPGMLPTNCLNGQGLVVRKDTVEWINLNPGHKNGMRQFTELSITPDGEATAKIVRDFDGYGYIDWADTLKANGKDPELMKNGIAKKHRDLKVLSYKITANDTVKGTSQETIEMDVSSQAIDAGGELLLNPFVLFEYTKNPFNASERKFPVDFTTPRDFTSTVAVRLPPGFGTLELPPSEKLSIPNGSASFTYQSSASSNAIQFRIILKLSKAVYTEAEYLELKQFFSHVVKKLQSPIRLSKT